MVNTNPLFVVENLTDWNMKIGIVAYEKFTTSMLVGVMDILSLANTYAREGKAFFEISIITMNGKPVRSFNQFQVIPNASARSAVKYDVIYVPGFLGDPLETINQQKALISWLGKQSRKRTKIVAACNGNVFLAEAGLLSGRSATTHWSLKSFFETRYPDINLSLEKIIVDEGDIISAAGVTAYNNLALYLVAKYCSDEIASQCSKVFLVDSGRKNQTPYMIFGSPRSHGDHEVLKVQDQVEKNFNRLPSVESLIREIPLGRRTLLRRFKRATGDTPLEYLQRIRIENAKRLLESSDKTFGEITSEVGYNDISSFQRLFKNLTGLTPREYRNKFTLVVD